MTRTTSYTVLGSQSVIIPSENPNKILFNFLISIYILYFFPTYNYYYVNQSPQD